MSARGFALPRSVAVLMPTYQAATHLERVLAALAAQRIDVPWELVALDCGSTDGTLSIFERWSARFPVPLTVRAHGATAFDHGDTRNRLAASVDAELLVYLTDDAIPAAPDWLALLRANFADPRVAAAFCRNAPRPDARPFARVATRDDPTYAPEPRRAERPTPDRLLAMGPEELRALYNYSDTASAVRRSVWELHPYPVTSAGEDVLLARALIDAGFEVRYDADAVVLHSHEWPAEQVRRRAAVDGRFNAEAFGRRPMADRAHAERCIADAVAADRDALVREGLSEAALDAELEHAREQRTAHFLGLLEGQDARARRPLTALLDAPWLTIGLVCGADAAERAGELRNALVERGHRCRILGAGDASVDVVHVLDAVDPDGRLDAWMRANAALAHVPAVVPERGGWTLLAFGLASLARPSASCIDRARIELGDGSTLSDELDAAEWESRYRGLACLARGGVLLERWARECDERDGAVREQGGEALLLGPGPAAVAFDLGELAGGEHELEVHLELLGEEPALALDGRVLVDGREAGAFRALRSAGIGRFEVLRARLDAGSGSRVVRIESGVGSRRDAIARVRRIVVRRPARSQRRTRTTAAALERLRVFPGPALADERLPRVAVVIVTLDARELLERCLAALDACDYPADKVEIVVVDNGSRDDTSRLLGRRASSTRVVALGQNLGFTRAVAAGVAAARRADVLVLLNNDVVVEPAFLRELVSPIARGECAAVGARMLLPDGRPEYLGGGANLQGFAFGVAPGQDERDGGASSFPRRILFACGGAMAIDADAWRDVGGLDPEFYAYYDDLDLGWRLWLRGHEVHFAPGAVCRHARSSTSSRFAQDAVRRLQVRNALLTCLKNYDDANLDRVLPALLALASRRAWVMSRRDGAPELALEGRRPLPAWKRWWRKRRRIPLEPLAFADFAAINEVLGGWDRWMSRRAEVQAGRRRGDAEILELFVDPLWCVEGEREYVDLQAALARRFGLAAAFDAPGTAKPEPRLAPARGCFEEVAAGANELAIAGWMVALDGGLDEVEIELDGRRVASAPTTPRDDVAASFPGANGALRSGFAARARPPNGSTDAWRRVEAFGVRAGRRVASMRCLWRADFAELFESPPAERMLRVAAAAAPVAFRLDGLRTLAEFLDALAPHRDPRSIANVLDWGAGCGRVTGFLRRVEPTWRVSACDVDADAVAWGREHHAGCHFDAIAPAPPTAYPDGGFDLILAYSVFTHLERGMQLAWLAELRRVLAVGGILLATVQGPEAARLLGLDAEAAELRERGIADASVDPALDGVLPDGAYRRVFQSEAWTREHWGRELAIVDYLPRGAQGLQDLVVLRKEPGARSATTPSPSEERAPAEADTRSSSGARVRR